MYISRYKQRNMNKYSLLIHISQNTEKDKVFRCFHLIFLNKESNISIRKTNVRVRKTLIENLYAKID